MIFHVTDATDHERLMSALRDVAVFEASTARRPWRLSWPEVADRVRVDVQNLDGIDGDMTSIRYRIESEGIAGEAELSAPATVGDVLGYLVELFGDVAAELWRTDAAP
jgi:hypothetical protein